MLIFAPTVTVVTVTVTWTLTVTVTKTVTVCILVTTSDFLYYGQAGEYINSRYADFCQDNESSDCEMTWLVSK